MIFDASTWAVATPEAPSSDPVPPHDAAAEGAVLSCIMQVWDTGGDPSDMLRELEKADFFDLRNQKIYLQLRENAKEGKPTGLEGVLPAEAKLGGRDYLVLLANQCPNHRLWTHHLQELRNVSRNRALCQTGREMVRLTQQKTKPTDQQIDDFFARVNGLRVGKRKLPPIVDAAHLEKANIPTPPELVEGILRQGSKMMLGGGSKTYKTHVLLDLAHSISSGTQWWGMPTTQGRVLFVNLELQEYDIRERNMKICAAKGVSCGEGNLDIWNLRGHSADISKLRIDMMPQIRRHNYAAIIMDPLYKLLGDRDENSASNITGMLNEFEAIAVDTGAAVIFSHHFSKGNQSGRESIDRPSGSGAFGRDSDAILTLTGHDEDDCFTVETTLRNFPPLEAFVVQWNYPLMVRDDALDPNRLKQRRGNQAKHHTIEEILAHVPREGSIDKNQLRTNANKAGIAQNKVNGLIDEAVDARQLFVWMQPRPGTHPKKLISRKPQPEAILETCKT